MTVHCFTSASFSYLAKARVLGNTLKRFHPDWLFTLCVTDREPPGFSFDLESEPFDSVIWSHDLPVSNAMGWLFKHDVVEACTAVKGPALKLLLESGADHVFYLDPDIAVFGPLDPMVDMLDRASILLTPHQLTPESSVQAIVDNEICSLSHGTYNLGSTGLRGWIYLKPATHFDGLQGRTTESSRQILVTHVGAKSPADGVVQVGGVGPAGQVAVVLGIAVCLVAGFTMREMI